MISAWILVVVFSNGFGGAVTTVGSYHTQAACENARTEVVELRGYKSDISKQRLLEQSKCVQTWRE